MTNQLEIAFHSHSKESTRDPSRFCELRIPLLVLVMLIVSCTGLDKAKESVNDPTTSRTAPLDSGPPVADPSFVETRDVVSTHGPRSITRNLLQDRNGIYWFASWEGIVRYDGKLFTNVTLMEGLRRFHVFSILETKQGNLWFGTIRGGAYRYDGRSFTLFTVADGLASNVVTCMLEDRAGNIWFGTDQGVSRYDGRLFTTFTTEEGLPVNSVHSIAEDKTGKLWFGTNGGISWYEPSPSLEPGVRSFTDFTNQEGRSFSNVRSIIEDKSGAIWIGSQAGLHRYDGKSMTRLTSNPASYVFEDRRGNLWLSAGKVDGSGMTLSRYDGTSFATIVTGSQIFGITEDRAGNIWFGTVNGACRYDGRSLTYCSEKLMQ